MTAERPRLAPRARLRWDERDATYMIVYPERGLVLNETGAAIVKMCDGTRTVEQIVAELSELSGAAVAKVDADVRAFLERLRERKLLA